jgi:hypothetical protein
MSQGKFSIVFLSKYNTKNLVRMLLLLSEFSPSDLGLDVGHALQLSKILSNFIKRNVPRSFSASASFLGRDLIISVFVSSRMDGLNLSSILNLPSVLDCLPPYVRKFWSPPLVAWKYVKTSGFSAMGRWVDLFVLLKLIKLFTLVVLVLVSLVLLIPIMVMLFLLTLISFLGPA